MADTEKKILISAELKTDKLIKDLAEVKKQIADLRAEQSKLDKSTSDGRISYEAYDATIRSLTANAKSLQKEIDGNVKAETKQAESIRQLETLVSKLKDQYYNLNEASRASAKGVELENRIKSISTQVDSLKSVFKSTSDQSQKSFSDILSMSETTLSGIESKIKELDAVRIVSKFDTTQYETATNEILRLRASIKDLNTVPQSPKTVESVLGMDQNTLSQISLKLSEIQKLRNNTNLVTNQSQIDLLTREEVALKSLQKTYLDDIKIKGTQQGSIVALRVELSQLIAQYDNLGKAERESAAGQELLKSLRATTIQLNEAEQASLRFQRNVGNYKSGFNGLQFQVNQLTRELPSLAYGFNMFVAAVSNNYPMLIDEVKKAKTEFNELKTAQAEGLRQNEKAVPVWKQLTSAVLGWQTLLVIGVTLLIKYGDVVIDFIASLFKMKSALDIATEAQKQLKESYKKGSENAQKELVSLKLLYEASQNHANSTQLRKKAIDELQEKYPAYFKNMSDEEILAGKAAMQYENLAKSILSASKARAVQDTIVENQKKIIAKEIELAKANEELQKAQSIAGKNQYDFIDVEGTGGKAVKVGAKMLANAKKNVDNIKSQINEINSLNSKLAESIKLEDLLFDEKGKKSTDKPITDRIAILRKIQQANLSTYEQIQQESLAKNKAIFDDDQKSYNDRLSAAQSYESTSIELINKKADYEKETNEDISKYKIALLKGDKDNIKLYGDLANAETNRIEQKRKSDIEKIRTQTAETIDKINKNELSLSISTLNKELAQAKEKNDQASQKELLSLSEQYVKKMMRSRNKEEDLRKIKEWYEKEKLNIAKKYSDQEFTDTVSSLESQLALSNLDAKQKEEIEKQIAATKAKYAKESTAIQVKANEDQAESVERKAKRIEEAETKLKDLRVQLYQQMAETLKSIVDGIFDSQVDALDEELDKVNETKDAEVAKIEAAEEAGTISTIEANARKKRAEEKAAADTAKIEKEKKKAQREKALFDRGISLFNIGLSTAEGIMKAIAEFPLTAGQPFASIVAAIGALQAAAVLATPLPKAARGGVFNGPSHTQGGIPIEVEGDEIILTKGVFRNPKLRAMASALNEAAGGVKFASGGIASTMFMHDGGFSQRYYYNTNLSKEDLREAMSEAVKEIKIYTTVEDIRKADKNYTDIENRSIF